MESRLLPTIHCSATLYYPVKSAGTPLQSSINNSTHGVEETNLFIERFVFMIEDSCIIILLT